ncbi:hypothetical protein MQE23_33820 [Streptomyces sp. HP-A2021]|uniref:hypothetical protein n=1 Tax=Streptomyces sp. HP-A2021 TaxID=2927875 RepID=UPI001FAEA563|nr:hypothetical protein [Streptomyces sp. HP-A2021]UOB13734.1 hypothetical protein MQE23_33820 [Streptomyces sp. HP-A2021]
MPWKELAGDEPPVELGDHSADELVGFLARRDRDRGRDDSVAVRYGTSADLSCAVAYGEWPGRMGPMHTWSHEITGPRPELLGEAVRAVGILDEDDRDAAHAKSLAVVEETFRLTLPREQVLHQAVPAALIKGQLPA